MLNINSHMNKSSQSEEIARTKASFFKNEIVKGLLIALISVFLSQGLAYYFWTKQFQNTKEQKILEFKIDLFKEFTKALSDAVYCSEGSSFIYMEIQKMTDAASDSIYYATGIRKSFLDIETNKKIRNKANNISKMHYDLFVKGMENRDENASMSLTVRLLYGEKVHELLFNLSQTFNAEYSMNFYTNERVSKKLNPRDVDIEYLASQLANKRKILLELVLQEMMKQIK